MVSSKVQSPSAVVMVRPASFHVNPETAADNVFQAHPADLPDSTCRRDVAADATAEFDAVAEALTGAGVTVHVFEDDPVRDNPDAVFPNNWFSTHHGGRIAVYPMYAPARRRERRQDILEMLKTRYRVQEIVDYSGLEPDELFLEGTGAMVFDHVERVAYVAESNRANPIALERFCTAFGYEPMVFANADPDGNPIYHTNVIMCIASEYAMLAPSLITDPGRRDEIVERLRSSGRTLIELDWDQVCEFAGNALELCTPSGPVLAMSARAADSLRPDQREVIEASGRIVAVPIPTIELSGGSVRCMLAGVHLTAR